MKWHKNCTRNKRCTQYTTC